jgi:hypothetical protein
MDSGQSAADPDGAAIHDSGMTDEECDARSGRAQHLGLGRNLVLGYNGPRWTKQELKLLCGLPDAVCPMKKWWRGSGGR